jgi:hypothetical protein
MHCPRISGSCNTRKGTAEPRKRKYASISFADTGHRAPQHLAYRFSNEKLNPTNQVDPFYIAKSDISKIVAFRGVILKM